MCALSKKVKVNKFVFLDDDARKKASFVHAPTWVLNHQKFPNKEGTSKTSVLGRLCLWIVLLPFLPLLIINRVGFGFGANHQNSHLHDLLQPFKVKRLQINYYINLGFFLVNIL